MDEAAILILTTVAAAAWERTENDAHTRTNEWWGNSLSGSTCAHAHLRSANTQCNQCLRCWQWQIHIFRPPWPSRNSFILNFENSDLRTLHFCTISFKNKTKHSVNLGYQMFHSIFYTLKSSFWRPPHLEPRDIWNPSSPFHTAVRLKIFATRQDSKTIKGNSEK